MVLMGQVFCYLSSERRDDEVRGQEIVHNCVTSSMDDPLCIRDSILQDVHLLILKYFEVIYLPYKEHLLDSMSQITLKSYGL